jgi:hypothetical protein
MCDGNSRPCRDMKAGNANGEPTQIVKQSPLGGTLCSMLIVSWKTNSFCLYNRHSVGVIRIKGVHKRREPLIY